MHSAENIPEGHGARRLLIGLGAIGVLISGYMHFYLYFEGGYRGIAPDSFAGLTISRAFAVNAAAGLIIAELLIASLIWPVLQRPAVLAGFGFAVATLTAYALARTVGLLGFRDDHTISEAVIAVIAELGALGALGVILLPLRSARAQSDRT